MTPHIISLDPKTHHVDNILSTHDNPILVEERGGNAAYQTRFGTKES